MSRVNKGKALTQKEFRNSVIGAIEKRKERRTTQFQKDLEKMIRKSDLIEEDPEDIIDEIDSESSPEPSEEFSNRNSKKNTR